MLIQKGKVGEKTKRIKDKLVRRKVKKPKNNITEFLLMCLDSNVYIVKVGIGYSFIK